MTREEQRLAETRERTAHWRRWGPYLSERQWGTVREDYSADGTAWDSFPHEHARSRAYRWGEDGIAGISDNHGRLCFALALWNGRDAILKERLFGLTGNEGNHGEDVKEYYFYLDSTPTHSYMKYLYKYPQAAFPYGDLVAMNRQRDRRAPEYELVDTGAFEGDRYFDVVVEYAKASPDDILIRISATNRGPVPAELHLLPTLWYRNTWSWGASGSERPALRAHHAGRPTIEARHGTLGTRWLHCDGAPELLFTENETNCERLWGVVNPGPYVKDGINDYVVSGWTDAVNSKREGTKAAARYRMVIAPGATTTVRLRLADAPPAADPFTEFERVLAQRRDEADEFYATVVPSHLSADARNVMRQALAGLLWSKQFYHYDLGRWLDGDPVSPPPSGHRHGRNRDWRHLYNEDVISMPDKWEYPWYAAWDLAFHMIPFALVDPEFAKAQLLLFLREWYMHPNGQIPAYEWAFGDVNPPVHAWAALRVYRIERRCRGTGDREFLAKVFHKLLLNFTWWVNRKDAEGKNVFQGGFLGLDNIGVFDRSTALPTGGHLEQSDGTSWMGMYCLNMLAIALELAKDDRAYEDVASKFFEHFVYIAHAMHDLGGEGLSLWDEQDGFFYDVLHTDGQHARIKVRSMVGLIPLLAVQTLEPEIVDKLPGFKRRMQWFIDNHPELREHVEDLTRPDGRSRRLLSIVSRDQLPRVLRIMLDEAEFLAPHGIRAVSRVHRDHPYVLSLDGMAHRVDYEPAESSSGLFGGNSNWRGPIWFPVNYLLIEALQKFHHFYGDTLKVACPAGVGPMLDLWSVAGELSRRLTRIFLRDEDGRRPVYGGTEKFQRDPHWRDLILFYEYFHGDNGAGIGASHQTGWTGLVAKLLQQSGE
ncbi:MAG: glucosidase [Candidatus Rokubacteria bacterium 13_1_40CM_68_15]|nr:MAG: glucosidase [Candidatus Rokubacteria bacterium 13_1_40CM_68_15]